MMKLGHFDWKTLCLRTLVLGIWSVHAVFSFQVTGWVAMVTEDDLNASRLTKGDTVDCSFSVDIQMGNHSDEFMITLRGDSLQFPNGTDIEDILWSLEDANNLTVIERNSSELIMEEVLLDGDSNDTYLAFTLKLPGGLESGDWTFNGSYTMELTDEVYPGSLVRSVIEVTAIWDDYSYSIRTVPSNYIVLSPPTVTVEAHSSLTQTIMGLITIDISIATTEQDAVGALVECLTPYENTSKEVMLTVQALDIRPENSTGISDYTQLELSYIKSKLESTLGSYQMDLAVLDVPRTDKDENETTITIVTRLVLRVEDYSDLKDGDVYSVMFATSFQTNQIFTGEIPVTLEAPDIRRPALAVSMTQTGQCSYDGSATVKVKVDLFHLRTSTATAYNVTLNMYLVDYLTMKKKDFTMPKENTIVVEQDGSIISTEITRMTFSDPFTLIVDLSANLSSLLKMEASERIITAEAVYNDRWGNETDLLTDTCFTNLYINKICAQRFVWSTSATCECVHSPGDFRCGCCEDGACQCGVVAPKQCVPCDQMWRCRPYIAGFRGVTRLKNIYCDPQQKRRMGSTGVSCYKKLASNEYREISPNVGMVTGYDPDTTFYYGIGNTGLTRQVSRDNMSSWYTLLTDEYEQVSQKANFEWAIYDRYA